MSTLPAARHLHPLSVKGKALGGREVQGAQASTNSGAVHVCLRLVHKSGGQRVEVRLLKCPPLRMGHAQPHGLFLLRPYVGCGGSHDVALGILELHDGLHPQRLCPVCALVGGLHIHLYLRLLCIDASQPIGCAPLGKVNFWSRDEPRVAVDAGASVPAGIELLRMVHAHGHNVLGFSRTTLVDTFFI